MGVLKSIKETLPAETLEAMKDEAAKLSARGKSLDSLMLARPVLRRTTLGDDQ